MADSSIFNPKLRTFCLITGASRGLGKSIAKHFAPMLSAESVMVLVARSGKGLEVTREEILANPGSTSLGVRTVCGDVSRPSSEEMGDLFAQIVQNDTPEMFGQAIIVHNAGTLGDVGKNASEFGDPRYVQEYFDVNVTSCITLNSRFLQYFTKEKVANRVVIGISTLCSLVPFKTWSLYCTSKAGRDMFFKVLATEEPDLRVISYAPGPIDTQMQYEARTLTKDQELRETFAGYHQEGKLVPCDLSVAKLMQILDKNKFESGAHIDYYDEI